MNIVFVTTQSPLQSTVIGRVMPLAQEFKKMGHEVTVLVHEEYSPASSTLGVLPLTPSVFPADVTVRVVGPNPFTRTSSGKKRHSGLYLFWIMLSNAFRAAWRLIQEKPDRIIIVKPLPENTLAVLIAKIFLWKTKIILDVDDFELFANKLSSLTQRGVIHWSERAAVRVVSRIVVATPFLMDYMKGLTSQAVPVTLIPTGYEGKYSLHAFNGSAVLLYMGSVSSSSGHTVGILPEILQEVRKEIPNACLVIAGSGDDEEILKKQFHVLGLDGAVTWFGRFGHADVQQLVGKSSILIDPIDGSIVSRAKSSFRVMIAGAFGMPVVTSNIGIRPMIISQEFHGRFFAKANDAEDYAKKIIALLKNPVSNQEKMRMQEKSQGYQWDSLAKEYILCVL